MIASDDIIRLRESTSDDALFQHYYTQDVGFKKAVDNVKAQNPKMGALEEANFPKAMLNIYYNIPAKKPASPLTTQMASALGESYTPPDPAPEEKGWLDPNSVEDPSVMGFAGNVAKSGGRLIRDTVTGLANVFNPDPQKNTAVQLGKLAIGGAANAAEAMTGQELFDAPGEDLADAVGKFYMNRYGGLENLKKTAYEDPVGLISDVASVISAGGAGLKVAGKLGGASGLSNLGDDVARFGTNMEPAVIAAKGAGKLAKATGGVGKFAVSQATGLAPDTITALKSNPAMDAAKAGKITRQGLGDKVFNAIKTLQDEVSDTGKGYEAIRGTNTIIDASPDVLRNVLKSKGFKLDEGGKIIESFEGPQLTPAEIGEINGFLTRVDDLGGSVTPNQFLRVREKLSDLAEYDRAGRANDNIATLSEDLRKAWNAEVGKNVEGLRALDAEYSPIRQELSQIKKDFIDPRTGELQDFAVTRIANLTGKGKERLLERVEKLVPNIRNEVNALKAVEDIMAASGQKVGTYTRAALAGGGAATGNIPMVIAAILSTPSVATRIIKLYGKAAGLSSSFVEAITKRMGLGQKLSAEQAAVMSAALQWAENQPNILQDE